MCLVCCPAGIKVLARIVQVDARYAVQHQALVMKCLEHVDPTIQAKVCVWHWAAAVAVLTVAFQQISCIRT